MITLVDPDLVTCGIKEGWPRVLTNSGSGSRGERAAGKGRWVIPKVIK